MKRSRFSALTVFATLLLTAGCMGRRTAGNAADSLPGEICTMHIPDSAAAGEGTGPALPRIGEDGSSKRWGPFTENDTTFLFVEEYPLGDDTNRYKVFIRKGPQPATDPNFALLSPQNESDWRDFTYQLNQLRKSRPEPLPRHAALDELPRNWTPVRSFRGEYYVDGFNPYPVWISDSLFVRQFMDGPLPSVIEAAEQRSPTHYRLRTTAGYSGIDRVDIHIVDTVRKIAVFTFGDAEKTECFHLLYAPIETALGMNMVDFYSLELPEDEVEWDEVDYGALIRHAEQAGQNTKNQNETK